MPPHRRPDRPNHRTRCPPASSISISPALLPRRRRGAPLTAAALASATGAGSGGISLAISTATNDGSSEAPGTPITPSSANPSFEHVAALTRVALLGSERVQLPRKLKLGPVIAGPSLFLEAGIEFYGPKSR